ncbi:MAG: hypothetical protein GX639_00830 [Fibrobacter sp.]|nr:hypothetical protein [Fibrobacter sp.]
MKHVSAMPLLNIYIDSSELLPDESRSVTAVKIHQRLSQPSMFEITFMEPPKSLYASISPSDERTITIKINKDAVFSGSITAIDYSTLSSQATTITIRGFDKLYMLRKRQGIHTHRNMSAIEITREFGQNYGLDICTNESSPVWPVIIQYQESDLDFISYITQRSGLYYFLDGNKLNLMSLKGTGDSFELKRGENLLEVSIEQNGNRAYKEVSLSGWNPFEITKHSAIINNPNSGIDNESTSLDGLDGNADGLKCVSMSVYNDQHAESLTQAIFDRSYASRFTVTGIADGQTALKPGISVDIKGVYPDLDGKYTLTDVVHTVDDKLGYICKISTEVPEPKAPARGPVALIGEVLSVDDPDAMGRIKVIFPSCEDAETDWLTVLTVAGGNNKGLIALPDIGDTVLVLLLNNDYSTGVVLGGVLGKDKEPPDWGVKDNSVLRYLFATPGGQTLLLDDSKESIKVMNKEGSFLEFTPDEAIIHSETDLVIEAPNKNIVIKGNSIDFQQG